MLPRVTRLRAVCKRAKLLIIIKGVWKLYAPYIFFQSVFPVYKAHCQVLCSVHRRNMLELAQTGPLCVIASFVIWHVNTAFFSPLSRVPSAHWLAPWTKLWLLWLRHTGKEHRTRHQLHQQLGPVFRLAPEELSTNCIEDGVQTIYGHNFDKSPWFASFDFYG